MSKQFWLVVIVIVLGLVGIFSLTGKSNSGNSGSNKPTQHILGTGSTGVTLVEYGDYQCPYCGEYQPTISQVISTYSNQITYQFRNFPLTSIHQNAFAGARAAEAAGLMGKFWQMHDLLYTQNQQYYNSSGNYSGWIGASNPEPVFVLDAKSLGLNTTQFQTYYSSEQVNNLITADENVANSLGLNATPTFILDGKQVQVANSVQAFDTLINAAIASKTSHQSTTTPTPATGTTQQSKQ
jgi:protein-disulfide isomerase